MSRAVLVIGGLVVAIAGVVLVIMLSSSDGESSGPKAGATQGVDRPPPPMSQGQGVTVTDTPRLPPDQRPELAKDGDHPREYAVGDIRVRDHRSGDNAPMDIPPNLHPIEGRLIPSQMTHAISGKVKALMTECLKDVPRDARGDKPRLEGQISIAIKNKELSVQKAILHFRNMGETDAVAAAKQCMEQKAVGLATPAGEEADLESYTINLSAAVPTAQ